MTAVRQARAEDWPAIWAMIEPVFRAGETYAVAVDIEEAEARALWMEKPVRTFVAVNAADGAILGSYFLKFNQPGGGNHVCNCGYIVDKAARGQGIASQLCEHSQREAIALGFRAMQYNLVVTTNTGAIRVWQRHGFDIVGRLAGAFRHPTEGEVDALVMYKRLAD